MSEQISQKLRNLQLVTEADNPGGDHAGTSSSALPIALHLLHHVNSGAGEQRNHEQHGGSYNTQNISHTNNYYSGSRKSQLVPFSTVPFLQDKGFVDREELDQIDSIIEAGQSCALVGLGGVGKSQIAIEYSYRVRKRSPGTFVFWIHASSDARFDGDVQRLTTRLKIIPTSDGISDPFLVFHNWLGDEQNGKWLVVLDNADDASFFSNPPVAASSGIQPAGIPLRSRRECFPQCSHGSIIITSRSRATVLDLQMVDSKDVVSVDPMGEVQAIKLLQTKLDSTSGEVHMEQLANSLEYMPLAIVQAAAYINRHRPRCTIQKYLNKLNRSEKSRTNLLTSETRELRRDQEAKNSILLTWQISFEYIYTTRRSAADLLSLMSFYNHQGIPESLLTIRHTTSTDTTTDGSSSDKNESDRETQSILFEDEVEAEIDGDGGLVAGQHLVQSVADDSSADRKDLWKNEISRTGKLEGRPENEKSFVEGEGEKDETGLLEPDGKSSDDKKVVKRDEEHLAGKNDGDSSKEDEDSFSGEDDDGSSEEDDDDPSEDDDDDPSEDDDDDPSEEDDDDSSEDDGFREDIAVLKDYLFISEPEPGGTFEMHRLVQVSARAWLQATKTYQEWAHQSVRNLDGELPFGTYENMVHCQTLYPHALALENIKLDARDARLRWTSVLYNAASYAQLLGTAKEAERLAEKAYKQDTLLLGSENEETLLSQFLLSSILSDQGRYEEAEAMYRLLLKGFEEVLGVKNRSTLTSMNDLAFVLDRQGKHQEAEVMYRQVIAGYKEAFGSRHSNTLVSLDNLGLVLRSQGKYEEAESLHRHVLEDKKEVLGPKHPSTLISAGNLAVALSSLGQYEEAEALHRLALIGKREVLGVKHPETLTSLDNLGTVLAYQKKYKEAEGMHREALEGRKEVVGPKHPVTLTSMNNLAIVLRRQVHYTEAEAMYKEAWKGKEEMLGARHPSTMIGMSNLAYLLRKVGRYDEAMVLYKQASSVFASALGEEHPDYIICQRNMSECLEKMGQRD